MELIPSVQKYPWGKKGSDSLVGRLMKSNGKDTNFQLSEDDYFAELWIGTHPNGPSVVSETGVGLQQLIKSDPQFVGAKVLDRFGPDLPFLLKVLSVRTALSIQAHPDKDRAKKLHEEAPHLYKDDNHKPEMAIALTEFEVLCGFRNKEEIDNFLNEVPELRAVVGQAVISEAVDKSEKESLKALFSSLMKAEAAVVQNELDALLARIDSGAQVPEADLIKRLNDQFPGDVGIFCVFFLQHLRLQPGEAIFLPANEPHAYIFGDCVECMATSDNVVRAGLTPKFKDVETLTDMLTYKTGGNWVMSGQQVLSYGTLYNPPVPEFAVMKYQVNGTISSSVKDSCSVFLCVQGSCKLEFLDGVTPTVDMKPGTCVFVPADCEKEIELTAGEEEAVVFQAFATP